MWTNASGRSLVTEHRGGGAVPDLCLDYLGGYGFGARYPIDHQAPGAAPLSEGNILGFITGPLTGTPAIGGTRFTVVGKSPLTNGWGDANCGGSSVPR